jgi:outer membrane receptor protein involved in Fe transport
VINFFAPFYKFFQNKPFWPRSIQATPEGEQYAAYAEARWKIREDLIIDFGMRFDRQTYSVASTNEQTSPRVNVLYKFGNRTELRAAVGRFYQAQEINELQINDGLAEFFPPQYADHFVASLAHNFSDDLEIRVEVFRKNYNELIPRYENAFNTLVLLPELQIDRARVDASTAVVRGAEMTMSGEFNVVSSRWWLSYAWSVAEESIQRQKVKRSWDQTHAVKFGAIGTWGPFKVSAAGSWHSGWPKTELIVEEVQSPDGSIALVASTNPRNSLDHDPFLTLDLRASRDYQLRNSELTAFIEISNALNRENACCTEYSMQINEDGSSMLLTETEHWLPLVPSIGVIWRF